MNQLSRPLRQSSTEGGAFARASRWLGPLLFLVFIVVPPPVGLAPEAWLVPGLAVFMATLWVNEAAPIPVTAAMPVAALLLILVALFWVGRVLGS